MQMVYWLSNRNSCRWNALYTNYTFYYERTYDLVIFYVPEQTHVE